MIYLHLSGGDLAARRAGGVAHIDARVNAELFAKGLVALEADLPEAHVLFNPQAYSEPSALTSEQ